MGGEEDEIHLLRHIAQAAAAVYDSDDAFTEDVAEAENGSRIARDQALGLALENWKTYKAQRPSAGVSG